MPFPSSTLSWNSINKLPEWDGKNHVAALFGRIPGLTSEQLGWCATWFRSAVAHWLQMDMLHGNEAVPVLIGQQGCGKSTFAVRLPPEELRQYFLDHINFGNKFDSEMALTHNLLVNIDELANITVAQQGKLKQTLSKVKVNGRRSSARVRQTAEDTPLFWQPPTMSIHSATRREVAVTSVFEFPTGSL